MADYPYARATDFRLFRGIPLDNTYEHTVWFTSADEQYEYFLNWDDAKSVRIPQNSYQRIEKNKIRIYKPIRECYDCNYLRMWNGNNRMHTGVDYEAKNYYAFIKSVNYINDNTTEIEYELDVVQTFMFDFKFGQCFVEREIVKITDDNPYRRLIDENLEHGDYIINGDETKFFDWQNLPTGGNPPEPWMTKTGYFPVMAVSDVYDRQLETWITAPPMQYGNVWSGCTLLGLEDVLHLKAAVEFYTSENKADGIVAMFMAPAYLFTYNEEEPRFYGQTYIPKQTPAVLTKYFDPPTTIDGYTPKNKRLLGYPYSFVHIDDNEGRSADWHFEYFKLPAAIQHDTHACCIKGKVQISCDVECAIDPAYYKGASNENHNERLYISGFPQCSFNVDTYKAWLAMNANSLTARKLNIGAQAITGVAQAAEGYVYNKLSLSPARNITAGAKAAVDLAGVATQAYTSINSLLAEYKDHETKPSQSKGQASTSLCFATDQLDFSVYPMSITKEFAEILDSYFDRYGYKIHRTKLPELHHEDVTEGSGRVVNTLIMPRPKWYFLKTSGCTIEQHTIPAEYLDPLAKIFDNGITFWRNMDEVGDYSLDNHTPPNEGDENE